MVNENIDEGVECEPEKHTGGHILFQSLKRVFPEMRIIKDIFKHDKTAMIVRYPGEIEWEKLLEAEKLANNIIDEDREVKFIIVPKEEVAKRFGDKVRGRWDLIKDENIRVVEVDDFDYSACMGKHAKSTKEIGMIIITDVHSLKKDEYEIIFETGKQARTRALEMAKTLNQISNIAGVEKDRLIPTVANMKASKEDFEKRLREQSRDVLKNFQDHEEINGVKLYTNIFDGFDRNEIGKKIGELVQGKRTIGVFANVDGEKTMITAGKTDDIDIDLLSIVKDACQTLGGDAGAKKSIIVGGCKSHGLDKVFKAIEKEIKSKFKLV